MSECSCNIALPPRLLRGVTRTVTLTIKDAAGDPLDLSGVDLVVEVRRDGSGDKYVPTISVSGEAHNLIVFVWPADVQKVGLHTIDVRGDFGIGGVSRTNWHGPDGIVLVEWAVDTSSREVADLSVEEVTMVGTMEAAAGNANAQAYDSGTAFPANPKAGDVFVLTSAYVHDIDSSELHASGFLGDPYYYYTGGVRGTLSIQLATSESTPGDCWVNADGYYEFQNYNLQSFTVPNTKSRVAFLNEAENRMFATSVLSFQYPAGVYEYDGNGWTPLVTGADRAAWNNKYEKPYNGIPKADLASAVQTSLGKADTAYQKPQTGIPGSDLAAGVIPDISDVVKYSAQSLTDEQKTQARTNIGASDVEYFDVTYNVTTSADMRTAYQAGKTLRLLVDGMVVPMVYYQDLRAAYYPRVLFEAAINDKIYRYSYNYSGSGWSSTIITPYEKPATGIPAGDLAAGVIPTVPTMSNNIASDKTNTTKTVSPKAVVDYAGDLADLQTTDKSSLVAAINEARQGGGGASDAVKYTAQTLTAEQQEQARINIGAGTYSKPSNGIPASDLAAGVIPTVPTISTDISADAASDTKTASPKAVKTFVEGKGYGTYSKPSGGIPAADLASGVIPTVPTISTDIASDATSDTKTASPKAVKTFVENKGYGTYSKPSGGIPAADIAAGVIPTIPTISTDIAADKASTTKTASPSAVYSEVHPAVVSSQPNGGFAPNVVYDLGTLTGSVTFALATPTDNTIANPYYWTFETSSTAPTITWPSGLTWQGESAPEIAASKHYEIMIRNGYANSLEFPLPSNS